MQDQCSAGPDSTAVRVALWRAMHAQIDPPPHVLKDEIGLWLVASDEGWRSLPDMDPHATRRPRASAVARARFIEDLVADEAERGVGQYVILGAGLDSFAQRRPDIASHLKVFEVDRPGPQGWKRQRLIALGFGVPGWLRFVPADFEAGGSWTKRLASAGFDAGRPAVVAAAGVSMYLTREAIVATLGQIAALAPGSTLVMTFMVPPEFVEAEERPRRLATEQRARASGTPFVSFFAPSDMLTLARQVGFKKATHVSAASLAQRYFAGRKDELRPSSSGQLLVART